MSVTHLFVYRIPGGRSHRPRMGTAHRQQQGWFQHRLSCLSAITCASCMANVTMVAGRLGLCPCCQARSNCICLRGRLHRLDAWKLSHSSEFQDLTTESEVRLIAVELPSCEEAGGWEAAERKRAIMFCLLQEQSIKTRSPLCAKRKSKPRYGVRILVQQCLSHRLRKTSRQASH